MPWQGKAFFETPLPGAPPPPMPKLFKELFLTMCRTTPLVSGIIFNSGLEVERDNVALMEAFPILKDIPLRFVGPLMPPADKLSTAKLAQQDKVQTWLDRHPVTSVVHVVRFPTRHPCNLRNLVKLW
ncbi:hypothetical protein BV898_12052 [Hypsibius exemplaris]|uniref:Uncharacterized protein n=1 Tax=Hypsibius exemplaris TaxID=2072580 RepID=A0A1W0WEY7_HYPEX|nr:hypothetical protein BV898_12052 [Hypsibius exemplaris]